MTDYNDYDGFQWGICRRLELLSGFAPGTSTYNPTSYADAVRCGDMPNYTEPTPRGTGHRAAFPQLY